MTRNFDAEKRLTARLEIKDVVESLWAKLPDVARGLIARHQDLADERNRAFFENPDSPLEHDPEWHQWGIIMHSKMFEKAYREEIPSYLNDWGVKDAVDRRMSEQIEGLSKDRLLRIAIPLHDIGKFSERRLKEEGGSVSRTFKTHEAAAGRIIRMPEFSEMLRRDCGLTGAQIKYVARCAELHYELGIVRDEARKSDAGYTVAFARSEAFRERAGQLIDKYGNFSLEIGLLFLADSLAKTDVRISGSTDAEIAVQENSAMDSLIQKGLNLKLMKAVKQLPVNAAVAETYLKTWAAMTESGEDL